MKHFLIAWYLPKEGSGGFEKIHHSEHTSLKQCSGGTGLMPFHFGAQFMAVLISKWSNHVKHVHLFDLVLQTNVLCNLFMQLTLVIQGKLINAWRLHLCPSSFYSVVLEIYFSEFYIT